MQHNITNINNNFDFKSHANSIRMNYINSGINRNKNNKNKNGNNIYSKNKVNNSKKKEMFFEKIKQKKKTELCKNYELYKDCYYGNNCSFAHGVDELRDNLIIPIHKTKLCKSFFENKTCNFGVRSS